MIDSPELYGVTLEDERKSTYVYNFYLTPISKSDSKIKVSNIAVGCEVMTGAPEIT
jgi:hypothetical protein